MIELKLNQNHKAIECESKVRFREDSVELYYPIVGRIFYQNLFGTTNVYDYTCFACRFETISQFSESYAYQQTTTNHQIKGFVEFTKHYMQTNCFIVREVNEICCVISLENDSSNKIIHVNKCALEIS